MNLVDTHAHLDDEQFDGKLEAVIQRASQAGVQRIVAIGTTAESSRTTLQLATRFESVFAAVGIQPNYCAAAKPNDWQAVVDLASERRVVALGETGLDRYWDFTPFEIQQDYFDRHLQLSAQLGLPVVIHMRDCGDDILKMLAEARSRGPVSGVMHSFTGDNDLAQACLDLGLYISFAGMVTFKKSADLRNTAAAIPVDRILIETDSPYLSPHPKRGQRPNEPELIVHTAECLAEVRGLDSELFAAQTTENAHRLFAFRG